MSSSAGERIGPYKILSLLGAGGMGEVWRAHDERLNREVALKILPPDVANDPTRRARFQQEAQALGALNHPNIVAIYDTGQEDGRAYLVSELVDGESLRAVIDRGPLPHRKLIDYAVQMAEALAAAHELGIVHRDFKPENVMLARSGRLKVLDFGLAKQSAPAARADKTATMAMGLSQPGSVLGTAGYMSPEQVRGEPVDARSDIFSFGCVLYEMIAGKRAFQANTSVETMSAILNQEPADLESQQLALPPSLATIVRRCLEKRPEQRFQSAADLAFALRAITTTAGSGVHAPVKPAVPRRRAWMWISAIAACAVMFAAGFLVRAWMARVQPQQFQRLTFRKGYINNALFTPDGANVVYSAVWEGVTSGIYLAVPGNPESRDLGLPPGSRLLAISSKQELAYTDASGNLMRGSLSGGQMRPLLDNVAAADWSPDGSALAVLREQGGKYRIEYPIGNVILPELRFPLESIRVSPDGNYVAFVSFVQGRRVGLGIVDRAGKRKDLGPISGQTASNSPQSLCWTPKGDEIWFRSFDSSDSQTIYAVDVKGRRRVVANFPGSVALHDLSKDGRALVSMGSVRWGILGSGPGQSEERDLSCLDQGVLMGISDDGRLIAASVVGDSGGPKGSIYVRATDGSPPFRLGDGTALRMSPDGKWVSGSVPDERGARRFVMLPTGPGEEVTVKPPGMQAAAVFGWLAGQQRYLVTGRLEHKGYQCFAWDAANQKLQPVCPEGTRDSFAFFVSPDGKQVLTPGPHDRWMVYSAEGGPSQEVHGLASGDDPVGWRADNRSMYVAPHLAGKSIPVSIIEIASGKRTLWKEIRPSQPIDFRTDLHLHIAPDGRAYAYNVSLQLSDLYLARGLR